MPRTIDSMLAAHRVATERRNNGQPVWDETVDLADLFHNTDLSQAERYARIADRIKRSRWYQNRDADGFDEFGEAVENLAVASGPDEFDGWFDEIYDQADRDRVWIKTR
ncbi:hypothetical protein FHR83_006779 [Actinoplanes campanulatus]|uniref:Uncharacterized protein n=1 Tax=Actinoplanes campanulatus TaxID=113559 RepID=A0A7W5AMM3_9ACTN|nr:hypothetical protein [Actinoplanes campanulatus]MBB3099073.1 hypothetical protein [Actinoplanes campanulatus]GGN39158.1 hypothetical protein GCM10010109_66790 [Actinoplanes campanulatus]GID40230.1 hypothetical protein Aca09nite_67360 [Actinoplanes campanulatus]